MGQRQSGGGSSAVDIHVARIPLARPEGLEPPAYKFEACCSIPLSYERHLWKGSTSCGLRIHVGLVATHESFCGCDGSSDYLTRYRK
jgi:hypothetical protein